MYCFFFRSPFLSAVSLRSDRSFCYLPCCTILSILCFNFSNFVCIFLYVYYDFSLICFSYLSLGVQITKQHSYFYTLFSYISIVLINLYSFHFIYLSFTFFEFLRHFTAPRRPPIHLTFTFWLFLSFFLYNTLLFKYDYAFFHVFITFHSLLVFNLHK